MGLLLLVVVPELVYYLGVMVEDTTKRNRIYAVLAHEILGPKSDHSILPWFSEGLIEYSLLDRPFEDALPNVYSNLGTHTGVLSWLSGELGTVFEVVDDLLEGKSVEEYLEPLSALEAKEILDINTDGAFLDLPGEIQDDLVRWVQATISGMNSGVLTLSRDQSFR